MRLCDLIDVLGQAALVVGIDGRVRLANGAAARLFGQKPTDLDLHALGAAKILASEAGDNIEIAWGQGTTRRHAFLTLAVRHPDGQMLLTAVETTDGHRRLAETQTALERYVDMVSAVSDIFHELRGTTEGRISLFVPERHDGTVTINEYRAKWPDDCVDPSYRPDELAEWMRLLAARRPYRDRVHRSTVRSDGQPQYFRASGMPFYDADGVFQGFRGVSINVTRQVMAEQALKRSEVRLRRSQQHLAHAQRVAAIGSIEHDLTDGTVEWSDEMYRLLGMEPTGRVPDTGELATFFHPDDHAAAKAAIDLASRGLAHPPAEFRVRGADGKTRTLYCETDVLHDEDGRATRAFTILKDVTELRARIAELETARRELQRQSTQLELAACDLARARDMAEAANRTKSTFLANMSHELRTPLNAIIGFSQVMRDGLFGELPARYRRYAGDINASGEHLLDLINEILDLSKIEAGRAELSEDSIDIGCLMADCKRLIEGRAVAAGIGLHIDVPESLPKLRGDEVKLRQILLNLLTNAVKFTPAGGTVSVAAWIDAQHCLLTVRDTGIGMKPEDVPIALLPFRQVGARRTTGELGTGLGLPLTKALVELHGGQLEIDSRLGHGTTVTVALPLTRVVLPTRATAEA